MWKTVEGFPNYELNDQGEFRNKISEKLVHTQLNQFGAAYVPLRRNGKQNTRSVPLLVAQAFLPSPPHEAFDTPINLNGDRMDNRVENLAWRPRWFAVRYQRQFRDGVHLWRETPIFEVNTGEEFTSGWVAALTYGLLYKEVMKSAMHQTPVWPTYQVFDFVE